MKKHKISRKILKKAKAPKKKITKSPSIATYERAQSPKHAAVCRRLRLEINAVLPKAISKFYHRIPVWFIGENAVVGFMVTAKNGVNLIFWNGKALKEPELKHVGQFQAAQIQFQEVSEINVKNLHRWLKKAKKDIWDFKGLFR